jgi:histidinol-phosphatase (PHP family)
VSPQVQIEQAVRLGLKGLALTDHYDIDYPNNQYCFEFNLQERRKFLHDMQLCYHDKLVIVHGIEIGIQPHVIEKSQEIIRNGHFDFVICSTHAVDGYSLCSQSRYFEGKTQEAAYRRYLEEVYHTISNFHDYDIVGHIGYVRRYGPYPHKSMPYDHYHDILDMILKKIISDGKGIEINTSGYAYKLDSMIPELSIVQRYKELGGSIITIGSDAHSVERIADHFQSAAALLKQVGFAYVAHFIDRKPVFEAF